MSQKKVNPNEEKINLQNNDVEEYFLKEAEKRVDQNIDNPIVRKTIEGFAVDAANMMGLLVMSNSENIRLAAAKDILDRSGYKPIEKSEVLNKNLNVEMDEETFKQIVDSYLKKKEKKNV